MQPNKDKLGRFTKKFDEETEKQIASEYKKGKTSQYLGEKYGCNQSTIIRIARNRGIEIRPQCTEPIYSFDVNWLDSMDAPEKFYFLGMAYADGCVERNNRYKLSLQEEDEKVLEDIKNMLKSDRPLYFRKRNDKNPKHKNVKILYLISQHFCDRLCELGCIPRKSLILQWPEWMEDNPYIWSFIRGCFDGDGSIVLKKNSASDTYRATINYTGSKDFCNGFKKFLESKGLSVSIVESKTYSDLRIKELKSVRLFLNNIYAEKSIYMERKYERAQKFLNSRDFSKRTVWETRKLLQENSDEIIELYKKGVSSIEIGKRFKCGRNSILRILRDNNIEIRWSYNKT